ncbi:hypothetical protein UFOVP181_212 [uncultured Caudovirales phage]|uniref:Uncharacterized protein n=1 Tax=uncultured Caudovirales phage TaxID=2100421 RepID=A0A6J5KYG1_9CAUD|nr:hypothetical protein UFOVP57_427 [uncultured Caudovirales phage]CAB5208846.1 hypothetical protein UFOVP181_212 [uncultured Caudovirales phage]
MNTFFNWFSRNNTQIVWFLIGFFIAAAVECFSQGNFGGMLLNLVFAGLNYFINRK